MGLSICGRYRQGTHKQQGEFHSGESASLISRLFNQNGMDTRCETVLHVQNGPVPPHTIGTVMRRLVAGFFLLNCFLSADQAWWMTEPIRWVQTNLRQTDASMRNIRVEIAGSFSHAIAVRNTAELQLHISGKHTEFVLPASRTMNWSS
jgi:hypothetical protein